MDLKKTRPGQRDPCKSAVLSRWELTVVLNFSSRIRDGEKMRVNRYLRSQVIKTLKRRKIDEYNI